MKRIAIIFLILFSLLLVFSSCGGEISTDSETQTETATETAAESETDTQTEEISPVKLTIDKDASVRGEISFDIEIDGLSGEYSLIYADREGKALPYFSNIKSGTLASCISACNIVLSRDVGGLLLNVNEESYFLEIPNEYLLDDGYRFSALSDVHFNKGDYFTLALDFLDSQGIDFVGVSGDLSGNGELEYLEKFNEAIKNRLYKVYTTSGNHDEAAVQSGLWKETINTTITTDNEVVNIAKNGLDFVYKPTKMGEGVFIFLCQTHWLYPDKADPTEYTILDKEQLDWLKGVLEEYKDENVFLFFHTFLTAPGGDETSAVGNLQNPGGYKYPLSYTYGSSDEIEFRALMKEYKNVIYFSGHSHWMFEMETYNENINFYNFDGEYGYMVHVPSVCEPRWIGENDEGRTSKTGDASEGWIVEVYNEAIVFIPVDFISRVYYTEYMEIIPLH